MRKTKTQKGIQTMTAGFALSILTAISYTYNVCFWLLLYSITVFLWMVGTYWVYKERKEYKEQHQKSVEISAWLLGIAVAIIVIGSLYFLSQALGYIMSSPDISMTKDDAHAIYTANINYGYVIVLVTAMLACSRTFAVSELQNKKGRRVIALALVVMLLIAALVFVQFNGALTAQDEENSHSAPFKKSDMDSQFSMISDNNRLVSLLPLVYELVFILAYLMLNERFSRGELKPRAREEE